MKFKISCYGCLTFCGIADVLVLGESKGFLVSEDGKSEVITQTIVHNLNSESLLLLMLNISVFCSAF
jgi:uncharacterized protein YuzB (UPF0349 family)